MRVRTGAIIIREKKTSFIRIRLAPFWVRSWLLHIYFDSMKLHHKILQWLSIFLFYLDSQLFLHPILQIHQLSIWYVYVCIKLTTYYCMNSIRNDFIMQPHTFFFFIANVQIVKKVQNWNVVCTFWIFFMKWQVEANHMCNLTADMIWMIFLKLQTYSKPNLWNVTIIEYIVFEDLKCLT